MMLVVQGVLGGTLYALTGYLKSGERFSYEKLLRTILLGAVVGFFNTLAGIPMDGEAVTTILSAGEVVVVENILKSLLRVSRL